MGELGPSYPGLQHLKLQVCHPENANIDSCIHILYLPNPLLGSDVRVIGHVDHMLSPCERADTEPLTAGVLSGQRP